MSADKVDVNAWGVANGNQGKCRENRDRHRKAVTKRSAGRVKTNSEQIEARANRGQKGKNRGKRTSKTEQARWGDRDKERKKETQAAKPNSNDRGEASISIQSNTSNKPAKPNSSMSSLRFHPPTRAPSDRYLMCDTDSKEIAKTGLEASDMHALI